MKISIYDLKMPLNHTNKHLKMKIAKVLKIKEESIISYTILKKAIDARNKTNIIFVYHVEVETNKKIIKLPRNVFYANEKINEVSYVKKSLEMPPIIIGFGPAGMFSGLYLARCGLNPIILERGLDVENRSHDVEEFFQTGHLKSNSNIQFGEGGAGTFSDGKLSTGNKDEYIRFVLEEFVHFGAPENILYDAKPHIGTDILKKIVKNIRLEIIRLGGQVFFSHQVMDIVNGNQPIKDVIVMYNEDKKIFHTKHILLALGHSARDTFQMLYDRNFTIEQKAFAMGLRIEHPQELINKSKYAEFYNHPRLGAAEYKLAIHLPNNRSVYTFCMCPGGVVVNACSKPNTIVTNGMSYHARNLQNANSAILVNITPEDFKSSHPLAGIAFQEKYEHLAYNPKFPYYAPVQLVKDFIQETETKKIGSVIPTIKPGYYFTNLHTLLPKEVSIALKEGIKLLDQKLKNFSYGDAVLTGVETRTSSPIRIVRNKDYQSNFHHIYPCGEGAGYAGGIMSASIDGLRVAMKIVENIEV